MLFQFDEFGNTSHFLVIFQQITAHLGDTPKCPIGDDALRRHQFILINFKNGDVCSEVAKRKLV